MTVYWIQNADYSNAIEDDPVQSVSQVIDAFNSNDWAAQNKLFAEMQASGEDCCPPGLGVVREAGVILHLCPDGAGNVMGFWHSHSDKKILGLFKSTALSTQEVQNISMDLAREALSRFIKGDDEWLARNFKDN